MDTRRVILYAALALIIYSLWTNWQIDNPTKNSPSTSLVSSKNSALLPDVTNNPSTETKSIESSSPVVNASKTTQQFINVKTDLFNIIIDGVNGDVVKTQLLHYPVSAEETNKPITLLNDNLGERYVANSSLFIRQGNEVENIELNFQTTQPVYQLKPGQEDLVVQLNGETANGLKVKKIFTFKRDSYLIQVNYSLSNQGNEPWQGYMNTQLLRQSPLEDKSSMFQVGSYTGASYSVPGEYKYKKVPFKEMGKKNLNVEANGGWVAMQQHYFLSAWVPDSGTKNVIYTRTNDNDYTIGIVSSVINLAPGQEKEVAAKLYIGPENTQTLSAIAPGLELTVDYGWLWFLSTLLFTVMKAIYSVIGNWGWSIVLVTVFIKLAFYRLSASSYKSMAGMRRLQPKLQALRERYGDDRAKMTQATMELYRQEKVKPLGGCLPILIQIPVFIALYWVLIESVELRQAPFILWIRDLSAPDPFHVLPIIMGATMLIQQRLNPAPPDPTQAKVMMFLPVLFTALFWNFPSGLVLYWIVNNTLSILQQWYITRKYNEEPQQKNKKLLTAK